MSTIQTLREPKTERLRSKPASQNVDDVEAEEPESNLAWYRRWCRESRERRRKAGLPEESDMTMEEIVAIVKEVRAERYAEKQRDSTCR